MSFPTFPIQSLYQSAPRKPTAAAFSVVDVGVPHGTATHTDDALAYDPSTATKAVLGVLMLSTTATSSRAQVAVYSGFGTGLMVGSLNVVATAVVEAAYGSGTSAALSTAKLEVSTDGGGSWTLIQAVNYPQVFPALIVYPISGAVDLAQLQVKATAIGDANWVSAGDNTQASATLNVFDVVFV